MNANIQELAQTLFEEAGDALFLFDPDNGRIADVNPTAQRLCGANRPALLKETIDGLFRSEMQGGVARLRRAYQNTGTFHSQDGFFLRQRTEGNWVPVNITVARLHVTPKTLGLITARDVSERRRTEAALRESEALKRAIVESALDCIISMDHEGTIIEFNPAAEKVFGHLRERALGQPLAQLIIPAASREAHAQGMAHYLKTGKGPILGRRIEITALRADGTEFPVELTVTATQSKGNPVFTAFIRDITEWKRAETELRRTSELLRAVADGTTDAVFVKDLQGRYLLFNRAASGFVGKPVAEVLGKDDTELFDAESARRVMERDRWIMESGATDTDEEQLTAAGVRRTYHATKAPCRDKNGKVVGIIGISRDITSQKRVEQSLRDSESRYRSLAESAVDGIFVDKGGRIVYANPALVRMLGAVSSEDILGKSPVEIIHPDYQQSAQDRIRTIVETGLPIPSIEEKYVRFDGTVIEVESSAAPFQDQGEIAFHVTLRDIGGRKRVETALRREREFVRMVLDTDPNLIFVKDAAGRFVLVNKALADLYGTTCDDLIGKQAGMESWTPAEYSEYRRVEQEVLHTGRLIAVDETNTRPDGRKYWFHTIKTPLVLPDGTTHVLGIAADITDRMRAELALRQSENLFRNMIANIPCAVFWKDRNSVYLGCNDQVARTHGLGSSKQVIGRTDYDLGVTPSEAEFYRECDRRVMETGEPILDLEETQTRADGALRTLLTSKVPLRDPSAAVVGVLGVYQDITERKRLQDQYRQSQKMEAVGQLAGGVAHDFNNLLTVISGYSEVLLGELPAADPNRSFVAAIHHAGERAASLTRQLLAFSRKQILEPKIVDLNEIIRNVEKLLRRLIGEDVVLLSNLDQRIDTVKVDPGQFEQVVMNLAINARDAMPQGGQLTIETRNVAWDEEFCRLHAESEPGDYVMLSVTDTGHGMTPEVRERIFEPFFTTKEQGKGTGLGLATVFGIVKQSEGLIRVYSEVAVGTSFQIYFPSVEKRSASSLSSFGDTGDLGGNETILLVEDEEAVRRIGRLALETRGYTVLEASGGKEGLQIAQTCPAPIHLVVSDVVMPEMGGRQMAEQLRKHHQDVRLLFMSGYTDDAVIRHGIVADQEAFIQKPFSPRAFAAKVREVLNRKR